jgi:2-isopropylmalate synthase
LLLFLFGHEPEKLKERFGLPHTDYFINPINLKKIVDVANLVSNQTGVKPKISDPIVGTGVNSISTGTPFINPLAYQPFDAKKVLGVEQKIYPTHLANARLVKKIAEIIGVEINENQVLEVLNFLKTETYIRGMAVIEYDEIKEFINNLKKN